MVVEDMKQLDSYLEIAPRLPALKALVVYNDTIPEGELLEGMCEYICF